MKLDIATATNNEQILRSSLLASGDLDKVQKIHLQRGYKDIGRAYNFVLGTSASEYILFIHQDVYLPDGWFERLEIEIEKLNKISRNWAIAGLWGVDKSGGFVGHVYDTGFQSFGGHEFSMPREVRSMDELAFVIKKSSGLKFDEKLPGFHMYATDLCLSAEAMGSSAYVCHLPCIHNTNRYGLYPLAFWRSVFYVRSKWKKKLPVTTPSLRLSYCMYSAVKWELIKAWQVFRNKIPLHKRVADPRALWEEIGL